MHISYIFLYFLSLFAQKKCKTAREQLEAIESNKKSVNHKRYSQSNGKVENAVKTAKRLMTKAVESGNDPFLALLEWRNTPSEQLGQSPAQILMGRRTRTRLPTANALLQTESTNPVQCALATAKDKQARYYNRHAKERKPFEAGQTVRVKVDNTGQWKKGRVVNQLPFRSYDVELDDGTMRRRTSRHVRFSAEPPTVFPDNGITAAAAPTPLSVDHSSPTSSAAAAAEQHNMGESAVTQTATATAKHQTDSRRPDTNTVTHAGRLVRYRYRDRDT